MRECPCLSSIRWRPLAVSWRRTFTRRQLVYRSSRQTAWLRSNPDALHWQPLDKPPWWALSGKQPPANLAFADLSGADLRGICLERANLRGVLCPRQDLSGLCLSGALLREAILTGCLMTGTDLSRAHLQGADLSFCDLRQAHLDDTRFGQNNLHGARVHWDRVGPARWLVTRHDGVAHGGLGELEQDFVYQVTDQKSGRTVAQFEASLYQCYWGGGGPEVQGPSCVEITPDARHIRLIEDNRETLLPLPDL